MYAYHFKVLQNIPGIEPELMEKLRKAYGSIEMFTMSLSAKKNEESETITAELPFAVNSDCIDGVFNVSIQGRMDTITAPELLEQFKEVEGNVCAIKVDVSKMSYVSSAGLRVLLIMYKSLEDKTRFELSGVSPMVREILETTGFSEFLM